MGLRQRQVKEEQRTFVGSVLEQATKPLTLFTLEALPQTFFGAVNHPISKQASHLNRLSELSFSKLEECEVVNHHSPKREISLRNRNEGHEVQRAIPKQKLKQLSKMFYQLIQQQGTIGEEGLKQVFLDKYQRKYGTLTETVKKNISRRYYSIKQSLVDSSFIQITDGQVSVVEDKCLNNKKKLVALREQITQQEKRNSLKEGRLNRLRMTKIAYRRLIKRNKQNKNSRKEKDTILEMPLFVYLQEQSEPTPYKLLKNDQVAIISGKQQNYCDDGDLLSLMHEELKKIFGLADDQIQ